MKTIHPTYLYPAGRFDLTLLVATQVCGPGLAEPRYVPSGTEVKVIKASKDKLCVKTTATALPFYGWIDVDQIDWEVE